MDILEQVAEIRAKEARVETRIETSRKIAENLLREMDLPVEKVAALANVPLATAIEIKESLHK